MKVPEFLKLNEVKEEDLDRPETTQLHGQIIRQKPFLRNVYLDFYYYFEKAVRPVQNRKYLEVGSGGGFLKEVYPQVIASDILPLPETDLCCSLEALPFKNGTLDGVYMLNVLHHVKDCRKVFTEFIRALKPGAKVVFVEPANTFFGRYVYQHFHHEPFDPKSDWLVPGEGPLSDANGAIPWIVFCRDREKFEKDYPQLVIEQVTFHTPLKYLLSGGVSMKSLLPNALYPVVKGLEWCLTPLNGLLGMFMTVVLTKK
ncbi:MAG: class I SAM-dependent methyltransferase [Candidatus Omnitrophica bacterium]|nr:class I SAM-dependent methyltransferase [Candidatus Omnitrophota bacterium]